LVVAEYVQCFVGVSVEVLECFPELHELRPVHSGCLLIIELEIELLIILLQRTLGLNDAVLLELSLVVQLPLVLLVSPDVELTPLATLTIQILLLRIYSVRILNICSILIIIILIAP
jgi:hypothetical protein